ncbi:MAG: hypothetical protein QMB55_05425 [Propionivibrio sp.]
MELMHNLAFSILEGPDAGIYRVLLDEIQLGKTAAVRLDPPAGGQRRKGGRPRLTQTKRPRPLLRAPLLGGLRWFERDDLLRMAESDQLSEVVIDVENHPLSPPDEAVYAIRKTAMAPFLDFDHLREQVLIHHGIRGLVNEAVQTGASESFIRNCFSLLCRFGFHETSLQPARHRCGAPGVPRPCDPGGRQKSGRKTAKQRIARAFGEHAPLQQPGISTEWRNKILAADKRIPTPKPGMPERVTSIIGSAFVTRYRHENGTLVAVDPKLGEYPNRRQIQRVLETEIPRLQRLLERTTKGHFLRSLRRLVARNWQGVSGPGHTWAIDSTIGDIFLRSSVNRAWIIGRPVVYIVVDVWSTAVVGFYVCLRGPSWDTAKVALFSSAVPSELLGNLWGYQPMQSLYPAPTMCAALLCDRGEYLSQAAKITGAKLIPCMSYTPPYRPDLKGLVEVLHRIAKDEQFYFVPGAINHRRAEFELRKINLEESVLTVPEYIAYLHTVFTEYNLTAPRQHRIDAHMNGAGVFPSPAGLWRYGHEKGIGVRRNLPVDRLITDLLPTEPARVTRRGIRWAGKEYRSDVVDEQQWTALARNFGGWEVQASHFPGSLSRIWTPQTGASGLLELSLADHSTASPELTVDEWADAYMFGLSQAAETQHANHLAALHLRRQAEEIIARAKGLTREASDTHLGTKPTMSEARQVENQTMGQRSSPTPEAQQRVADEADEAYHALMQEIFADSNRGVPENE